MHTPPNSARRGTQPPRRAPERFRPFRNTPRRRAPIPRPLPPPQVHREPQRTVVRGYRLCLTCLARRREIALGGARSETRTRTRTSTIAGGRRPAAP